MQILLARDILIRGATSQNNGSCLCELFPLAVFSLGSSRALKNAWVHTGCNRMIKFQRSRCHRVIFLERVPLERSEAPLALLSEWRKPYEPLRKRRPNRYRWSLTPRCTEDRCWWYPSLRNLSHPCLSIVLFNLLSDWRCASASPSCSQE